MSKIRLVSYDYLTNEQLISFTLEEMERLKTLSYLQDFDEYEKRVCIVNQLIIEVKRRKLYIKNPLLARRILNSK